MPSSAFTSPLFTEPKRRSQWTPALLDEEKSRLLKLGFFQIEELMTLDGRLQVIGKIGSQRPETGKHQSMTVRVEYPAYYPSEVPEVFDHLKTFRPSADGHLFSNHKLCLTFPDRNEFSTRAQALSVEVLGAALLWLDKRMIFERTGCWPGEAEPHGYVKPLRQLLLEEAVRSRNPYLNAWTYWLVDCLIVPEPFAGCPCCSGIKFIQCHTELFRLTYRFICARLAVEESNGG